MYVHARARTHTHTHTLRMTSIIYPSISRSLFSHTHSTHTHTRCDMHVMYSWLSAQARNAACTTTWLTALRLLTTSSITSISSPAYINVYMHIHVYANSHTLLWTTSSKTPNAPLRVGVTNNNNIIAHVTHTRAPKTLRRIQPYSWRLVKTVQVHMDPNRRTRLTLLSPAHQR